MNNTRKSGYYRVKFKDEWLIKFYSKISETWYLFNEDVKDDVFQEIDENRVDPIPPKYRKNLPLPAAHIG